MILYCWGLLLDGVLRFLSEGRAHSLESRVASREVLSRGSVLCWRDQVGM